MKVQIDLPEFIGFEYTGEYRLAKGHEWYVDEDGPVQTVFDYNIHRVHILCPVDVPVKMLVSKLYTSNPIRQQFWIDVYRDQEADAEDACAYADEALAKFDKRFKVGTPTFDSEAWIRGFTDRVLQGYSAESAAPYSLQKITGEET